MRPTAERTLSPVGSSSPKIPLPLAIIRLTGVREPIVHRYAASGKPVGARARLRRRKDLGHDAWAPPRGRIRPLSVDHERTLPAELPTIAARDAHAGSGGDRGRSRSIRRRIA